MKRFLLYLLFLLTSLNLTAQVVYPIRTNTILSQPLPYRLSGFVSEPGKMTLNIFVDDVNLDQYAVKFRVHFEGNGNGIKLSTRPNLYQEPYYLDGGMTHSLTGFELENLMDPNNLVFEGYSRQQYKKDGRLPEGVYRVWVDVIDYYRNVKVSMSTPGIAMIYMAKAPRLSFPGDKLEIDPGVMQSIRFSWFSILPADPLADIAYRFKLYEIRPVGRDPYEVVNVMQPVYQEEVDQANFNYDLSMPPLISGQWYAWRVEAYDRENRVLFQNNGHSHVATFRYGQSCKLPELRINSVENHDVTLAWQPEMNTKDYLIAYKKAKDNDWAEKGTSLSQIKIGGLDDNTGYQVKIKSLCGEEETEFSRIYEFKTPREINYACGKKGGAYDLSNTDPLPVLERYDEFKAADFIIEVEEIEGGDGYFSGNGYALVPYLGYKKFKVNYENIFVNSDGRMTSGEVMFVYDKATGMVIGENKGGDGNGGEDDEPDVADELDKISDQVIESDQEVDDVVIVGDNVVITYGDGSTKEVKIDDGKKVSVVGGGDGGNAYVADPGSGKVFKTPKKVSGGGKGASSVGTAAQTGQYGCSVLFSKADNQRFGFDKVGNGKNKPDSYFKTTKTGTKVAWKSLETGASDFANLKISGNCSPDSLRFIRNSGLLTPSMPKDKGLQVLLTGLVDGEEDLLTVATVKTEMTGDSTSRETLTEVGALGLVTYDRISRDVVLVPVNGAQCPQQTGVIVQELNEIYATAVVDWNVSIQPNLEVDKIKGQVFEHSGTGTFSKYTPHMRQVIKAYKKEHETDKQSLYLFFIDERTATKTGFMPLASEYGFIFNFGTDTHVLAHELGHGKDFNLRHTFSDKAPHFFPEKSTQNLMDYAGGSELWKYQWDLIHNPEKILFSWAQDENEGAAFGEGTKSFCIGNDEIIKQLNKDYQVFYLPDGRAVDLKGKLFASGFFTKKDKTKKAQGAMSNLRVNSFDYKHHYLAKDSTQTENVTKGYGFVFSDNKKKGVTTSIKDYVVSDTSKAVRVFLDSQDASNIKLLVKGNGNEKVYKISSNRACKYREVTKCEYLWELAVVDTTAMGHEFTNPNNFFYSLVKENPCMLQDLRENPFYGIEIQQDWEFQGKMFKVIFLGGIGIFMLPVVAEMGAAHLSTLGEEALRRLVTKRLKEMAIDATIQLSVNMLINTVLAEEDFSDLDYANLLKKSLEDIIWLDVAMSPISNKLGNGKGNKALLLNAAWGCTSSLFDKIEFDGLTPKVKDVSGFDVAKDCLVGAFSESLGVFIGMDNSKLPKWGKRLVTKIKNVKSKIKNDPASFFKLCKMLNIKVGNLEPAKKLLKSLGFEDADITSILNRFCLPAGTPIYAQGQFFKKVENIQVGDQVDAMNTKGQIQLHKVVQLFSNQTQQLARVYAQGKELIALTPDHSVWTPSQWKRARDLVEGDSLLQVNQQYAIVDSVLIATQAQPVYNFEVEKAHNYFAGKAGILAHNRGCGGIDDLLAGSYKKLADKLGDSKEAFIQFAEKIKAEKLESFLSNINSWSKADIDQLIKYPNIAKYFDDQLAELLVNAGSGRTQILKQISGWSDDALQSLSASVKKINAHPIYKFKFELDGDQLTCYLNKTGNKNRTRIANIDSQGKLKLNEKDYPFGSAYTIDLDGSKKYVVLEKDGDMLSFRDIDASEASDLNRKLNNRQKMADLLEADSPICAKLIRQSSGVRGNLLKSFTDRNNLLKFRDYYPEGSDVYKELSKLADADKISVSDLNGIFKDYQAHHIIPVNVISDNKKLQKILEHAEKNGFNFNDADNSIFLHIDNHSGSHGEYDKQIKKIVDGIPTHNLDEAVEIFKDKIEDIKDLFSEEVIGEQIKINDFKL